MSKAEAAKRHSKSVICDEFVIVARCAPTLPAHTLRRARMSIKSLLQLVVQRARRLDDTKMLRLEVDLNDPDNARRDFVAAIKAYRAAGNRKDADRLQALLDENS